MILHGDEAKHFCKYLLEGVSNLKTNEVFRYQLKESENTKTGYWYNADFLTWTAFDNRTHDCWVEDFKSETDCLEWLNDTSSEAEEINNR